jgi:hypothetical protein
VSDFGWVMLAIIVYMVCKCIVRSRGKTWDE